MDRFLLEVCCGSSQDALEAARGGADRVELNACLFYGGLTPTVGALKAVKAHSDIPVMCMIRPRQGGFRYTDAEFETALYDARALLEAGADGLVFGFLNDDGTVDAARCRTLVQIAGAKQTVFHRAIDVTPDWRAALDILIDLGVTRVLTSGQAPDVSYGLQTVRAMREYAGKRLEILPGAGVTAQNARRVLEETGCGQIHVARFRRALDPSTRNNRDIFFGGALYPPEDVYEITDGDYIASLRTLPDRRDG